MKSIKVFLLLATLMSCQSEVVSRSISNINEQESTLLGTPYLSPEGESEEKFSETDTISPIDEFDEERESESDDGERSICSKQETRIEGRGNNLDNPHEIHNAEDFIRLIHEERLKRGEYYILCEDIDLSDYSSDIEKIKFEGHFNGNNHKIKNYSGEHGLFHELSAGGTIRDTILENVEIECVNLINEPVYCGTLVDKVLESSVKNIQIIGDSKIEHKQNPEKENEITRGGLSGVIGYVDNTYSKQSIKNIESNADVSSHAYAAGIIAYLKTSGEVSQLTNNGKIISTLSNVGTASNYAIGGVIARVIIKRSQAELKNLLNTGEVKVSIEESREAEVGGVIGAIEVKGGVLFTDKTVFSGLVNSGDVKTSGEGITKCLGGIIGYTINSHLLVGQNVEYKNFNQSREDIELKCESIKCEKIGGIFGELEFSQSTGKLEVIDMNSRVGEIKNSTEGSQADVFGKIESKDGLDIIVTEVKAEAQKVDDEGNVIKEINN